ncbi:siderophore-interacting protein [Micromonospora sp. SH-82]|uniref:siderophore-interacting protein n=1 Tax=Micromonospora sp. SH-82 TaxID=3132938 RepID=UPI003EBA4023
MKRSWGALVLKAMGGRDFRLTVLDSERVSNTLHRLHVDGGGLLTAVDVHPTMWIRLWFDNGGRPHQRAYTLVDPDPTTGRFHLEFALHDGCAARWAGSAAPGDTIHATLQGSAFTLPDPTPSHLYVVGDSSSLPAVNSLLDAVGDLPATIWLEYATDDEKGLTHRTRTGQEVVWVPRLDDGRHLVETVQAALPVAVDGAYHWVACEAGTTRAVARHLRRGLGVPRHQISALGYWNAR